MRILFVNEKMGWFGGVEQNIADTVAGLNERGVDCYLAYGERTNREPERYASLFKRAAPCKELGGADVSLRAIVSEIAPDCVYLHKMPQYPGRDAIGTSTRVVRMVHDHDLCCPRRHKYYAHNQHVCENPAGWRCWLDLAFVDRDRSRPMGVRFRNLFAHQAEMKSNRSIDRLLVGSRFMHDELVMNGFAPAQVGILPPVVRMKGSGPSEAAEAPHVLYVGQLIRGKGVDQLLESLARLRVPFRATIVGDGNARHGLEAQRDALGLNDRVEFTGWVPNHELGKFYGNARLLAVPARWPEPFGMIGLEAMHHARPVVGFRVGGIPDWLEHERNGLLVEPRDTAGYAAALELLLTDRALATRLGSEGLRRAETEFAFPRYLDRLIDHLGGSAS